MYGVSPNIGVPRELTHSSADWTERDLGALRMAAGITFQSQSSLLFLRSIPSLSIYRSPVAIPIRISRSRGCLKALSSSEPIRSEKGFGVGEGGGGGGSSGGGGSGGDQGGDQEGEEKTTGGMSMSQKLTLAYAALVGVGGIMGYLKSGSLKSAGAGGLSSLVLIYVYSQLPVNPVFASSLGLGVSAALLGVMGSRFIKSGKVFPAGVVSVVSFVMVGGYLHGVLRSLH